MVISHSMLRMRGWLLFALLLSLIACGGKPAKRLAEPPTKPAIQEQSKPLREPESPFRIVVPGDTLYSIAWGSGRDHRELAIWNKLAPPDTIKPGQQIRVLPPAEAEKPETPPKPVAQSKPATRSTTAKPVPLKPAAKSATPVTKPSQTKPAKTKTETKTAAGKTTALASPKSGDWAWPADGQVLNRYSESNSKGLDIGGSKGAPVRAAAGGRVVYQGSGLRGYGQLIIIKHSDEFLSAYAHNDRIHVKEGDVVKRGQKIADMGNTGADRVKLHFEIRRQGTPIDPLKYLPKR